MEPDLALWEVTQAQLAAFFGVAQSTVRRWNLKILRRQGRFAVYDLREAVRLHYAEQQAEALDLQQERARLARAQREKIDLELAARAGELLEAELVVGAWEKIAAAFRSYCERTIASVETATAAGQLEPGLGARLADELRGGLAELARFDVVALMPGGGDAPGAGNGRDTATAVDRSVGRRKSGRQSRGQRARGKVAN